MYLKEEQKDPVNFRPLFDHKSLLIEYVQKLRNYRSHEEKGKAFYEDYNLAGMFRVI